MQTMDESKAVLHLLTLFPYKSETFLRNKFRKCNNNMSATIEELNRNSTPENRNGILNFFNSVFCGFGKLCCGNTPSTPADHECRPSTSTSGNVEFFEIDIGEKFAKNLIDNFGDSSLRIPNGFQPVVQIPVTLGKQLYLAYVESVFRQQEAYDRLLADCFKEDEEFAKRLQAEEDRYAKQEKFRTATKESGVVAKPLPSWEKDKNTEQKKFKNNKTISSVPLPKVTSVNKRQSEFLDFRENKVATDVAERWVPAEKDQDTEQKDFKNYATILLSSKTTSVNNVLREFPEVHKTKISAIPQGDFSTPSYITKSNPEISTATDAVDKGTFTLSPEYFRKVAQQHVETRKNFYKKAKQCLKENNHQGARYYFQQAKQRTQLIEEANSRAAEAFLAENYKRNPREDTIDLHHLYVREAIQALDNFLDDQIFSLEDEGLRTKSLLVITGRGKHSKDGVPKIKFAVMERLKKRNLRYVEDVGSLKVHIYVDSYFTEDLCDDD